MSLISKKRRKNSLTDAQFGSVVHQMARDAAFHIDAEVAPEREIAMKYYNKEPFGDEEEGRSAIVISTVRDTVNAVLPSLLRVFGGTENAVEFVPSDETEVQQASDATAAINHIFSNLNNGFSQVYEPAFFDALVLKTGVIFWWMEPKTSVRPFLYKGLTEDEMRIRLVGMPDAEVVKQELCECDTTPSSFEADPIHPDQDPAIGAALNVAITQGMADAGPVAVAVEIEPTYDFTVLRKVVDKQLKVKAVPPEELIISRNAQSIEDAACVGRRRVVTVGHLVALGFDKEEILANMGSTPIHSVSAMNNESLIRDWTTGYGHQEYYGDDSLKPVVYSELYCRIDSDGDGIQELHRVQTIGEHHYVIDRELWEESLPPLALLCPFPRPHTVIGMSLADRLTDLQEINSRVWRNTLDSFAQSIHPRTAVVETAVNLDDVLNTELGAVIRMRQPGAVQEFTHTFQGQNAMPLMAALEQIKAERTGISAASQGLNPEVLQSTTASAVAATTSAADQTLEMIARRFAETGIKQMFRGMLRMACRHLDKPLNVVRPDGTNARITLKGINPDLLISCNVGLGKGKDQDRLAIMSRALEYQIQMISQVGVTPIVGPKELRNSLVGILQIAGIKDVTKFFAPIPPNWQPPAPQNNVNPQMMLAQGQIQANMQKNQIQQQSDALDHQRQMVQMTNNLQLEREKLAQERVLKLAELQAQYGSQMQQAEMDRQLEIERAHLSMVGDYVSQQAEHSHAADQAHLDRLATLHSAAMQHEQGAAESAFAPPPAPPSPPESGETL